MVTERHQCIDSTTLLAQGRSGSYSSLLLKLEDGSKSHSRQELGWSSIAIPCDVFLLCNHEMERINRVYARRFGRIGRNSDSRSAL